MRLSSTHVRLTLAIAILIVASVGTVQAQFGQTAMAPSGGLVNGAVARFAELDANGPGWMYWGVNAADRGLGYNGSYMTLGGFIPMSEDDLGGFWSADLRSHLSVYGGFFSNVGLVRKQFMGGTILGVGVYWDYDGDLNQYPTAGTLGTGPYGQFGHAYNQIGVSGEWLTDFGNLRSNGYIPVGTTASTLGAPGSPFTSNYLLCQYGLDAALTGADLEVGAYIPGLADWAGMISVGGYALGNSRYDWSAGTNAGQDVVPWFGGVYTRLDLTLIKNWDFSLQYNNDSYFDSTGFARLTYRMGGSRRRNVPDQIEQPMMRNEHIVRAHQTPVVAYNPETSAAYRVIHVDSSAAALGNGTAQAPVRTLADAQTLATNPYDIVYVHTGNSATTPYAASDWTFGNVNQFLIGEGSTLALNTSTCGYKQFFTSPTSTRPILESTAGVTAAGAVILRNGAVVDHLQIEATAGLAGIAANNVSLTSPTTTSVNDVLINNAAGVAGVGLDNVASGVTANFTNMLVQNQGTGLSVTGGGATVNFQGTITGTSAAGNAVFVDAVTNGTVNVNTTTTTLNTGLARNTAVTQQFVIQDVGSTAAAAIVVSNNQDSTISIGQARIATPTQQGVQVTSNTGPASVVTFTNLNVVGATEEAFNSSANEGTLQINGRSSLASLSTSLGAFTGDEAGATYDISLETLASANTTASPGVAAVNLAGTTVGAFDITDTFLVGGTPGTVAGNVTNTTTGPVAVTVPTP